MQAMVGTGDPDGWREGRGVKAAMAGETALRTTHSRAAPAVMEEMVVTGSATGAEPLAGMAATEAAEVTVDIRPVTGVAEGMGASPLR